MLHADCPLLLSERSISNLAVKISSSVALKSVSTGSLLLD